MKVKSESEVAQSCPTLRDPMDHSPPGSSIHGIFQARVLEWGESTYSNQVFCLIFSISLKNILHVSRLCLLLLLFPIVGAQISVKSETEDLVLLVVVAVIVV